MKLMVISDNLFYSAGFSGIHYCQTLTPEHALNFINTDKQNYFCGAVVIINISSNRTAFRLINLILKKDISSIFIEPTLWPARDRIYNICDVYILPCGMTLSRMLNRIQKCVTSSDNSFKINTKKIKASEWKIMLHLINGVSNRNLAKYLNSSEKTISAKMILLAGKMGILGVNKAMQLNVMYFLYIIHLITIESSIKDININHQMVVF